MKPASAYSAARERWFKRAECLASRLYGAALLRLDVKWQAPPPTGGKIFAGNHLTTLDSLATMALLPEPPHYLVADFAMKVPILGWYLRAAGHVWVSARNPRATFSHALRLLRAGRSLVLAPEGGLSPLTGSVSAPQLGLAFLALRSGAPVIPVGMAIDQERLRFVETTVGGKTEVARHYFRGPYCVTFGEALYFDGGTQDRQRLEEIAARVMHRISELAEESSRRLKDCPTA